MILGVIVGNGLLRGVGLGFGVCYPGGALFNFFFIFLGGIEISVMSMFVDRFRCLLMQGCGLTYWIITLHQCRLHDP